MRGSFVIAIFFVLIWYGFFRQYTLQATETMAGSAMYVCKGGTSINAFFYEKNSSIYLDTSGTPIPQGKVEIALNDGRSFSLPQVASSTGLQYMSDDETFTFWTNGNKAVIFEKGTESSFSGCVRITNQLPGSNLSRVYIDSKGTFSLRLPGIDISNQDGYVVNAEYEYSIDNMSKKIFGTSFHIPTSMTHDTGVLKETYISVESLPGVAHCTASDFFVEQGATDISLTENGTTYSVGSITHVRPDSLSEEIVYAISDSDPCVAIRYHIVEDAQSKNTKRPDKSVLLAEFDQIRHSLVVAQ